LLSLVRLLARANEKVDSFSGFRNLSLLNFTYPVRDRRHHIGSAFAGSFAGDPGTPRLPLAALCALYYSNYFFL
jgi:hypothetical protein